MARVKRSVHAKKKRREVLRKAKGYFGSRSKRYRVAKEQLLHSGQYAYRDRRDRKATGNHMLTKKSSSRRRRVEGMSEVTAERTNIRRLLGK